MISIRNLSKSYKTHAVLEGIQKTFQKGKIYGIVGANGAGKSTLFRCITGLIPYKGIIEYGLPDIRYKIGYLETDPSMIDLITGKEYLHIMRTARRLPPIDYNIRNLFQLPLDRYASTYSTGMLKKLALTGVLLQENEIYILDEPFNGVDIQSNVILSEIFKRLKDKGATLLISSHILSTLTELCDEISILENGDLSHTYLSDQFGELSSKYTKDILAQDLDKLSWI